MKQTAVTATTLEGPRLRLEPLAEGHHPALCAVGLDPELWRWTPKAVHTAADMAAYIAVALAEQRAGRALPFAIIDKASGQAIGSTRYGAIEPVAPPGRDRLDLARAILAAHRRQYRG